MIALVWDCCCCRPEHHLGSVLAVLDVWNGGFWLCWRLDLVACLIDRLLRTLLSSHAIVIIVVVLGRAGGEANKSRSGCPHLDLCMNALQAAKNVTDLLTCMGK